jgi:hypothetical protein
VRQITAKDHTGRQAYYVVLLRPDRAAAFDARQGQPLDLCDYGQVLGSCYGDRPTPELRCRLMEEHGFYEWEVS